MAIPDQQTLAAELTALIQEQVLETPEPLEVDTDLFKAGLDSMAIMQLLLLIEQRYGVMLPASDLTSTNFTRATDIAGLLHDRLATADLTQEEQADDGA